MVAATRLGRLLPALLMILFVLLALPAVAAAEADVDIGDVAAGNVPGLEVNISGSGITYYGDSILMTFRNDTTEPLVVHVPIGTQLIPANTSTQTMITAGGENITVPPGGSQVIIKAFCGEKNDHAPTSGDTFSVGDRATGNLLATAENINRQNAFDYDGQTAIWHITDGAEVGEGSVAEGLVSSGLSDGEKAATALITAGSAIAAAAAAGGGGSVTDDDLVPDEDLFPDEDWEDFDDFEGFEDADEPDPDLFPDEEVAGPKPDPDAVNDHTEEAIDALQQLLSQATTAEANRPAVTHLIKIDSQLHAAILRIEATTDPRDWDEGDVNTIVGSLASLISLGWPPAAVISLASGIITLANSDEAAEVADVTHSTRNLLADLHNMRGNVKQSIDDLNNAKPPPSMPQIDPAALPDQDLEPNIRDLHNQAINHLTDSHSLEQQISAVQSQLDQQTVVAHEMRNSIADLHGTASNDVSKATALVSVLTSLSGTAGAAGLKTGASELLVRAFNYANNSASVSGTGIGMHDWYTSLSGAEQQELWRATLNHAEYQKGMLSQQLRSLQQQHSAAQQAFETTSKLRTAVSNEYNSRFGRMPPRNLFGGGS